METKREIQVELGGYMKRILAIGAFERDNFGDLLFLHVMRQLLSKQKVETVPASIIATNIESMNGEQILPYAALLKYDSFDSVYVVGGEIGAVDVAGGLMMDLSKTEHDLVLKNKANLNEIVETYTGIPQDYERHAYIPELSKYPLNRHIPLILNSVGLSNIKNLSPTFSYNTIKLLKNATISVREHESQQFLRERSIASLLAPDIVHSIRLFRPKFKTNKRYVAFQIHTELIKNKNYSAKYIASVLQTVAHKTDTDIRLFLAGTAAFHDDEKLYQRIMREFKLLETSYRIDVTDSRDPLDLVDIISGAVMWIGTSLHGRIIAASYNVPRISLFNKKVSFYTETWDAEFPHGVILEDVLEQITKTQTVTPKHSADELAKKAKDNFTKLLKPILRDKTAPRQPFSATNAFVATSKLYREQILSLIDDKNSRISALENQVAKLQRENKKFHDDAHYYEVQLRDITKSRAYQFGMFGSKVINLLRAPLDLIKPKK